MKTKLFGKDFISEQDWTPEELQTALDVAMDLKKKFLMKEPTPYLLHQTLYMLFFFSSTRTRTSFAAAMDHLGGTAHDLPSDKLQIAHGDTPKEIGRILSSYGHGIAIRHCDWGEGNAYIRSVAENSSVPVFNMQCDIHHPFQAMADLMTILEKKQTVRRKKIVMSWAYADSYTKPISVPQSFLLLLTRFGADITLAYPKEFALMPGIMKAAGENAKAAGGSIAVTHNMAEAFDGADVVYPKSWGPLVMTSEPAECSKIAATYKRWICDENMMKKAKKDAIYMHCLPADRGVEVSDGVIDGPQSVVYDQAANRLHVQKAIMALTMGGR